MSPAQRRLSAPQWLVVSGGCVFILVLIVSAVFEPDIRWLHFFQAWMYVATIALSLRGSTWGHFVGASVAGLWDYTNLFVTNFLGGGVGRLMVWIQTGHLSHASQLIAIPAWLANLLVIIGCAWAYSRHSNKSWRDLTKFIIAFALSTGFFLADIALFQPRYLSLFPRMLHPHQPMITSIRPSPLPFQSGSDDDLGRGAASSARAMKSSFRAQPMSVGRHLELRLGRHATPRDA